MSPRRCWNLRRRAPRAGTFIYHTHLNDIEQLTSGMYGAAVVLERNQKYDPSTDHAFVLGRDGEHAGTHRFGAGSPAEDAPVEEAAAAPA